jgi:hypothetical protein
MDCETSESIVPTDHAVPPVVHDITDAANNECYSESADVEMVLDDRDPEGWDDVESNTSETVDNLNRDDNSADNFQDMYD